MAQLRYCTDCKHMYNEVGDVRTMDEEPCKECLKRGDRSPSLKLLKWGSKETKEI